MSSSQVVSNFATLREKVYIHRIIVGPSWMDPIVLFFKDDILPEEKRGS